MFKAIFSALGAKSYLDVRDHALKGYEALGLKLLKRICETFQTRLGLPHAG
jgi:hypothetical protein